MKIRTTISPFMFAVLENISGANLQYLLKLKYAELMVQQFHI